jgi:lysozyme family protein
MAQFLLTYNKYKSIEGTYSNDPDDAGGETWCGIARNFNPGWPGWKIIDSYKSVYSARMNLVDALKINPDLEKLVYDFYKKNYWDFFQANGLPQIIADELYDIAINCGLVTCVKYLQSALNLLNRNVSLYPELLVDGIFGVKTMQTLVVSLNKNGEKLLFNVLNCFQGKHYIECMQKKSSNEKYVGWFNRIDIKH